MSVSSVPSSPIIPTDFAAFLQSPEGVAAIQSAYTPPPVLDALAHNKNIIQDAFRQHSSTYTLPATMFNTVEEQQLWKNAVVQAHAPGMPAIKGRTPLAAIKTWINPTVVPVTSTALDWAQTDSDAWYLQFPASARPSPSTDAYVSRVRCLESVQCCAPSNSTPTSHSRQPMSMRAHTNPYRSITSSCVCSAGNPA